MKSITLITVTIFVALSACSSSKSSESEKGPINHQPTKWNHEKAREAKDAADAQTPQLRINPEAEAECTVMSKNEMIRAKRSGCRKLDPRLGHGNDSFCCPY